MKNTEKPAQHKYILVLWEILASMDIVLFFAFGNQRGGRSSLIQHFISKIEGKLSHTQQFL